MAATIERFGAVDILVNNAATNPYFGPAIDIDPARYDKTWHVNVRGCTSGSKRRGKRPCESGAARS